MQASIFGELSAVIAIATGVALLMRLIHQPLIIGHILTGLIVGPTVLHVIQSPSTMETFSSIGIALLLFIIGLGLNPRIIREVGKVATIAGVVQVGLSTAVAYVVALAFGMGRVEALFLGVALAFSSTIIILKLLSDKKEQTRLYGKIATGLLLIQDVLATIALLFVTANDSPTGFSLAGLGQLFFKGALLAGALFIIGSIVLPRFQKLIAGSQEFLFLFAIGWGFGSAALFEHIGFSLEIGALLAGVALAGLPYAQEISARLRPLRDFFIIVFFISLGTRLNFGSIETMIPIIMISSFMVIILKPVIIMMTMGLMGYTKRTSFKTAITMGQVSEFSIVFVLIGNKAGLVSDNLVGIITILALISIAASTYFIIYSDKLFSVFEHSLGLFERRKPRSDRESKQHYDLMLFGYQKGGHEYVKVFRALKKRFIVIDYDPEVIDAMENRKVPYIYGDAMDVELLAEAGLDKAKLVVSTISDYATNAFLVKMLEKINPNAVVIVSADRFNNAAELYKLGASYVEIPHYIGSEKIGSFIKKSQLKKSEFKKYRERHLAYLEANYSFVAEPNDGAMG
ncbi:MAG: cation:proton antiporter [Candidatus Saccharimonadales bacterium]